jgi:hypothetical protein
VNEGVVVTITWIFLGVWGHNQEGGTPGAMDLQRSKSSTSCNDIVLYLCSLLGTARGNSIDRRQFQASTHLKLTGNIFRVIMKGTNWEINVTLIQCHFYLKLCAGTI